MSSVIPFAAASSQHLYIMQMEVPKGLFPLKIGISKNPEARRYELQTASPYPIAILTSFEVAGGARNLEQSLHAEFADERLRGEWFLIDFASAWERILPWLDEA